MTTIPTIAERLELLEAVLRDRCRRGEELVESDTEWLLELVVDARERIRELARQYVAAELKRGAPE